MKKLILLIVILSTLMPAMSQDYLQSWPYTCNHVAIDSNGNVWIDHGFVSCYNGTEWKAGTKYPVGYVSQISVSPQGDVWVAGAARMVKINATDTIFYDFKNSILPDDIYFRFAFKSDTVWCFSDSGVFVYETNAWSVYDTTDMTLRDIELSDIDVDSDGNFWIATFHEGLIKYDGQNFTFFNKSNSSIPDNDLFEVLCDQNDNIWVGTENNGVAMFDGQSWDTLNVMNSNLPINTVVSLAEDDDTLWFGTGLGFCKYSENVINVLDTSDYEDITMRASSIAIDENNNKWLATGGGIQVFNEYGVILGIGGGQEQSRISNVFPNPNDGSFTIIYSLNTAKQVKIELFANSGYKVKNIYNGYSTENDNKIEFTTENLPSGTYYYRLSYNSYFETGKIIINK